MNLGVWGGYTTEGMLFTCSYDYLTDDFNHKSFVLFAFVFNYMVPMILTFFYYSSIVKAVWAHEEQLKAQAKRMNVESLRSNQVRNVPLPSSSKDKNELFIQQDKAESAEFKIAKVAMTNVLLWAVIW